MNYLRKSFSVTAPASKTYRDNFDKIFRRGQKIKRKRVHPAKRKPSSGTTLGEAIFQALIHH